MNVLIFLSNLKIRRWEVTNKNRRILNKRNGVGCYGYLMTSLQSAKIAKILYKTLNGYISRTKRAFLNLFWFLNSQRNYLLPTFIRFSKKSNSEPLQGAKNVKSNFFDLGATYLKYDVIIKNACVESDFI